jgi:O-antigen/teichoic acid export membrane protein
MSAGTLGAALYLALVLPPAEFAVFGYATTVFLIASAAGDLGLGAAIIREGPSSWRLERSLGLAIVVWVGLAALVIGLTVAVSPSAPSSGEVVLLALALALVSLQMIPTALLEQRLEFGRIAVLETAQRAVFVAIACAGASIWQTGGPVAAAAALSALFGLAAMLAASRWHWRPRVSGSRAAAGGFASDWWLGRIANQLNYATYVVLGSLLFTEREVGLMVWALAVTSVPTILAPLASRILLPNLRALPADERAALFGRLFTVLTFVSLPMIAVLFVCADQLTRLVFGDEWEDGIPLLRLECVTTVLGVALTPTTALLFLALDTRRVSRIMVAWTAASYALTLPLAIRFDYLAPSVAQIATGATALVVYDRLLREATPVHLIRAIAPGAAALVAVAVPGLIVASSVKEAGPTIVLALTVACAQVLLMEKLYGRSMRRDARSLTRGFALTIRTLQAPRR